MQLLYRSGLQSGRQNRSESLTISHLEFVTLTGLANLVTSILATGSAWFPPPDALKPATDAE